MKWIILAAAPLSQSALAADLCDGNTYRCWHWDNCSMNGEIQPCAYGSSSAASGELLFKHGTFNVTWHTPEKATVRYGQNNEFTAQADVHTDSTGVVMVLNDGTTIRYPGDRGE
ncbi:hypothetical protein [Hoeflea poritis]|uniref:Uncharacterized protein n=1 Tax=Hoeflea poritis TaxID=2993659 RepID=A0ABT4VH95_9HYPH|nr:hypothetical protein [Hoeflea poritis]MDA4843984.1 hypothetical protein [Hoeflea poritis]